MALRSGFYKKFLEATFIVFYVCLSCKARAAYLNAIVEDYSTGVIPVTNVGVFIESLRPFFTEAIPLHLDLKWAQKVNTSGCTLDVRFSEAFIASKESAQYFKVAYIELGSKSISVAVAAPNMKIFGRMDINGTLINKTVSATVGLFQMLIEQVVIRGELRERPSKEAVAPNLSRLEILSSGVSYEVTGMKNMLKPTVYFNVIEQLNDGFSLPISTIEQMLDWIKSEVATHTRVGDTIHDLLRRMNVLIRKEYRKEHPFSWEQEFELAFRDDYHFPEMLGPAKGY